MGCSRVLDCTGLLLTLHGCSEMYWTVLYCYGLYWAVLVIQVVRVARMISLDELHSDNI